MKTVSKKLLSLLLVVLLLAAAVPFQAFADDVVEYTVDVTIRRETDKKTLGHAYIKVSLPVSNRNTDCVFSISFSCPKNGIAPSIEWHPFATARSVSSKSANASSGSDIKSKIRQSKTRKIRFFIINFPHYFTPDLSGEIFSCIMVL